jgi:molecular chaperone DnaJ
MSINPFEILGVPEDANLEQIKKKYRQLSLQHHPDRGGDIEKFRKFTDAYSLINTEQNIKNYRNRKNSIFTWDADLENYFGDIFGSKKNHIRRTMYADLFITLEESFSGCKKHVFYKEVHTCRDCGGVGAALFDAQGNVKKACDGCLGEGVVNQTHETILEIPRSVAEGNQLSASEDLIVTVHVTPHPDFHRKGFDIHSSLNVSLRDIFQGSRLTAQTLHGDVSFDLPRCIQPEKILRLKKKGLFDVRRNTYGDHLLTIKLAIPEFSAENCDKIVRCLDEIQTREPKVH